MTNEQITILGNLFIEAFKPYLTLIFILFIGCLFLTLTDFIDIIYYRHIKKRKYKHSSKKHIDKQYNNNYYKQ